ncbi:unnamed protein product [Diatraea saccharalis]|uniref:Creatinase N-terminal domain-containing protein n=1 Tax=Diatraea saccharalis TaxID=40085 RepID=A0A9P0CAH1_9NEOP|nr:unnamed protein product [Diatraea saccharalis]
MSLQKLTALRTLMASQPTALAAYIVPTADAHNSEYIAPVDARREWLSGFTGSAGTAVVTATAALVWTDGRYYTQFEKETDPVIWTLMKQSLPDTPTMEKWLTSNLTEGATVGVDPFVMSRETWSPLQVILSTDYIYSPVAERRTFCMTFVPAGRYRKHFRFTLL